MRKYRSKTAQGLRAKEKQAKLLKEIILKKAGADDEKDEKK